MRALPPVLAIVAAVGLLSGPVAAQSPAASPAVSPAPSFGAAWTSVSCDTFNIQDAVAAISDCGYVTVPENRAAGTDSTIQLATIRIRSANPAPGTPMVIGSGGPGSSNFTFLEKGVPVDFLAMAAPVLADRDIVRWSERGTQYAKPFLGCPEYDSVDFEAALNGWTRDQIDAEITKTLTACADALKAQGVDLSAYNSNENAADVVDVAAALGYPKIAYYGQSYGTLLGQYVMRNHPEILESVILDGIVPAGRTRYDQLVSMPAAFKRLFDACAAQDTCKAQYGDLEKVVADMVAKLDKEPLTVPVKAADGTDQTVTIGSIAALNLLVTQMYTGSPDFSSYASQLLAAPASLAALLTPHPVTESDFARIQHFAINCSDDPSSSMKQFKLQKDPGYLRDFLYDDGIREVLACKALDVPQLPAVSDEPVTSDLPVLLLNGGLDPATPAAQGKEVGKTLPNSQYVLFPASGHVQDQSACGISIMAAFLKDPSAKVDTSCIPPKAVLAALTPTVFKNADGSASLTMDLVQPTWKELEQNHWQLPGQLDLTVQVLPATTTPDQAIKDALKPLGGVEDSAITDNDATIAGQPVRTATLKTESAGTPLVADAYAFSTPSATYLIGLIALPAVGENGRTIYPQLLQTVTVDPAP